MWYGMVLTLTECEFNLGKTHVLSLHGGLLSSIRMILILTRSETARKGHTVTAASSKFHSVGFKFFIGNVHIFVVIDRNV